MRQETITSVPSPRELVAFLKQYGFLTPSQLQQLAGDAKFADSRALAHILVQRNWLSPYQVEQIFQGRGNDLVLGPYRLLEQLGEGGMGQVFKAHHANMDRVVALKIIPRDRVSEP